MSGLDFADLKREVDELSFNVQRLLDKIEDSSLLVRNFFDGFSCGDSASIKDDMRSFTEEPLDGTRRKISGFPAIVDFIENNSGGSLKDGVISFGRLSLRRPFSGIINAAYAVCLSGAALHDKLEKLPDDFIGAFEMFLADSKARSTSSTSVSTSRSASPFADIAASAGAASGKEPEGPAS